MRSNLQSVCYLYVLGMISQVASGRRDRLFVIPSLCPPPLPSTTIYRCFQIRNEINIKHVVHADCRQRESKKIIVVFLASLPCFLAYQPN